jgi:hypothetical protein
MRSHGFLVGRSTGLREALIPGSRIMNALRPRRRLDDSRVGIFDRAVASNNLDAAADV